MTEKMIYDRVNAARNVAANIENFDNETIAAVLDGYMDLVWELYWPETKKGHLWDVLEELGFDLVNIEMHNGDYHVKIVTNYGEDFNYVTFVFDAQAGTVREAGPLDFDLDYYYD